MSANKSQSQNKKKRAKKNPIAESKELVIKEDGQEYARVIKELGGCNMQCECFDGVTRISHIRGKMRNRVKIRVDDIVLVGIRSFQDKKADIILKYSADEARKLKTMGELPEMTDIKDSKENEESKECVFDFESI